METESRAVSLLISIAALIGFIAGALVINSNYQKDTYDCTVKCPDNAHSIYINEKCYCEIK